MANDELNYGDVCSQERHKGDIVDFLPKVDEYVYSGKYKKVIIFCLMTAVLCVVV